MSSFILEYGTYAGDHVSIDIRADAVCVAFINGDSAWNGTTDQFEATFPMILNEMVSEGVLRLKTSAKSRFTLNPQDQETHFPQEMQETPCDAWKYVHQIIHPETQSAIVEAGEPCSSWSWAALHHAGCDSVTVERI